MNTDELTELVKQHGTSIYAFCYRLEGNKADADDLYQETFLRAVEMRSRIDTARNPRAFLVTIAIQVHRNIRRKLARRLRLAPAAKLDAMELSDPSGTACTPEDAVLAIERQTLIQHAAHQLNDKHRLPLYMHYTVGMTVEEIAAALKLPEGTIKSRLHKARQTLRKALEVHSL